MTLVVSDISRHGIVMIGDSAVTMMNGPNVSVRSGAVKVQYCANANIGLTMWGWGRVGNTPLDEWVANFLSTSVTDTDNLEIVGNRLAHDINLHHSSSGRPWNELVCGFHLGGFMNNLPQLYHVHCGHQHEPPHELRLYRDYPIDANLSELQFIDILNRNGFFQLRNGYVPHFGRLFDNIMNYSNQLKTDLRISFPQDSLNGRLSFYQELVKFVAGVLAASGVHPGVNSTLSSIAFDQNGIVTNQQLPFSPSPASAPGIFDYY